MRVSVCLCVRCWKDERDSARVDDEERVFWQGKANREKGQDEATQQYTSGARRAAISSKPCHYHGLALKSLVCVFLLRFPCLSFFALLLCSCLHHKPNMAWVGHAPFNLHLGSYIAQQRQLNRHYVGGMRFVFVV